MTREPRHGDWILPLLADFPGVSGEALRILKSPDSGTRWLLLRRLAEYEIRRDPVDEISDQVFRATAASLRQDGDEEGARTMDAIASTTGDLQNADLDWKHRYDARPVTIGEQAAADLLAKGRIWPLGTGDATGIDGAVYAPAGFAQDSGEKVPVVIAIMHAGAVEIISGFAGEHARDAWLADHLNGRTAPADGLPPGLPAPLAGTVTGPDCRTQREERILAWLLQHDDPPSAGLRPGLGSLEPHAFTTYSRSEIYLGWQQATAAADGHAPPPGETRHQVARRLLRAPAWAATAVGWPLGHHALAYLDRLAATPVTRDQAETATGALLRDNTALTRQAPRAVAAEPLLKDSRTPGRSARAGNLQRPDNDLPRGPTPRL